MTDRQYKKIQKIVARLDAERELARMVREHPHPTALDSDNIDKAPQTPTPILKSL